MPILGDDQRMLGPKEKFFVENAGSEAKSYDLDSDVFYASPEEIARMQEEARSQYAIFEEALNTGFMPEMASTYEKMMSDLSRAINDLESIKASGKSEAKISDYKALKDFLSDTTSYERSIEANKIDELKKKNSGSQKAVDRTKGPASEYADKLNEKASY